MNWIPQDFIGIGLIVEELLGKDEGQVVSLDLITPVGANFMIDTRSILIFSNYLKQVI